MLTAYLIGSVLFHFFLLFSLIEMVRDTGEVDSYDKTFGLILGVLIPMGLAVLTKEI